MENIMYCENCLKQMLKKLTDNDALILDGILDENAVIPQCSLSFQLIEDHFKKADEKITPHIIYMSLTRLNVFGFIETQKWSRKLKYYITEDGINLLKLMQKNME